MQPAPAFPHSLRHPRGRTLARSSSLDPPTLSFLLTRESPPPGLSRQVLGWSETSPPSQPTLLCRPRCCSPIRSSRQTHPPPAPPRLDRLCPVCLRWSLASVPISGPLHPSRGHLQSSPVGLRPGARHLSLEGLRPRRQARQDDPWGHGVLASLLFPRATRKASHAFVTSDSSPIVFALLAWRCVGNCWFTVPLRPQKLKPAQSPPPVPPSGIARVWRVHDRASEIYCCGTINMHLTSILPSVSIAEGNPWHVLRHAHALLCPPHLEQALSQFSAHTLGTSRGPVDHLDRLLQLFSGLECACPDSNLHPNPIAHHVRYKDQRLPPSLLIENASDQNPAPHQQSVPRRFRSRLAYEPEAIQKLSWSWS